MEIAENRDEFFKFMAAKGSITAQEAEDLQAYDSDEAIEEFEKLRDDADNKEDEALFGLVTDFLKDF